MRIPTKQISANYPNWRTRWPLNLEKDEMTIFEKERKYTATEASEILTKDLSVWEPDAEELEEFAEKPLLPAFLRWLAIFGSFMLLASIVLGVWK